MALISAKSVKQAGPYITRISAKRNQVNEILHKELSFQIVGAAMEVHRILGPGFLEAVYEEALAQELTLREIPFERQKQLKVNYKGVVVGEYIADIVVNDTVIIELKARPNLVPANEAQAINYLAATGYKLALILNFGTPSLQQKRIVLSTQKPKKNLNKSV